MTSVPPFAAGSKTYSPSSFRTMSPCSRIQLIRRGASTWQNLQIATMTLQPGTRFGAYEIQAPLGAGGMGEVYRARDTRLQRDVAIKVLPELFASDPERLARFEREAHLLAALNHPHIAQVYGLERQERRDGQEGPKGRGAPFIVMEFVDGPTLADRLVHGRIPLDEALPIARQIADALEAAHEQGIIHRDLKPANIKIRDDGTVKVLDFGLAKAMEGAGQTGRAGAFDASMSPTMISPAQMTHVGIILGTAAYVSPEQAKGRVVDKRADVWAFGCVLFEMLTGKPTFTGESVTETLASVMRDALSFDALPPGTPPHVGRLLRRCLERDPRQRLRDMGEARIAFDARADEASAVRSGAGRRTSLVALAVGALAAAIGGGVGWSLKPAPDGPLRKLDLALNTDVATLSPDGARIAYGVGNHVLVRDLTALEPSDLGAAPQEIDRVGWSPDGTRVFASARDGKIRTIPAHGGTPIVVCEIPESHQTIGVVWIGDELVFAVWRGSLYRVDARGGTPRQRLAIDAQKEVDFHALAALPDGRVVFAAHRQNNEYMIETFDGSRRAPLLPSIAPSSSNAFGAVGQFLYSATGHLLFTRFDTNAGLWAIPFRRTIDPKQMFLVAPHVTSASAANDGTLMMRMGSDAGASYELIAVDRSSRASRVLVGSAASVSSPKMSPDGRRVAMIINTGGQRQVWVQDIGSASGARLTFDDDDYAHPAWFPAGDRLLYSGHAQLINGTQIYAIGRDGSGVRKELAIAHRGQPSSDGKSVVYLVVDERGDNHLRRGSVETRPTELERVFKSDPEPDVHDLRSRRMAGWWRSSITREAEPISW